MIFLKNTTGAYEKSECISDGPSITPSAHTPTRRGQPACTPALSVNSELPSPVVLYNQHSKHIATGIHLFSIFSSSCPLSSIVSSAHPRFWWPTLATSHVAIASKHSSLSPAPQAGTKQKGEEFLIGRFLLWLWILYSQFSKCWSNVYCVQGMILNLWFNLGPASGDWCIQRGSVWRVRERRKDLVLMTKGAQLP